MADHIDRLIDSGVITRLPDGRIRITEQAWNTINQIAEGSAHSKPTPTVQAAHHNRSNKHVRY